MKEKQQIFYVGMVKNKRNRRECDAIVRSIEWIEAKPETISPEMLKFCAKINNIIKLSQFNGLAGERKKVEFVSSIIHMHFNRSFGDVQKEINLRAFVYRQLCHSEFKE